MCLRFGAKQTRIACGMKERCLVVHNISPSSSHLCLQGLLLIDVLDNQILRRRGSKEDQERCLMKTFRMTNHHDHTKGVSKLQWRKASIWPPTRNGEASTTSSFSSGNCLFFLFPILLVFSGCPFHLHYIDIDSLKIYLQEAL